MSREIRFRVYNRNYKKIFYNAEDSYDSGYHGGDPEADYFGNLIGSEDYELMQYVGINDDNGEEIYEGDIVHVKEQVHGWTRDEENNFDEYTGIVTYFPKDCAYFISAANGECLKSLSVLNYWNDRGEADIVVIGNIYENPELLERNREQGNR